MSGAGPYSVLLICHSYPPVLGGSEVEAQRVCEALMRRGHTVQVVCAGGDPMPAVLDWVDPKGIPVKIYGGRCTGRWRELVFALRTALLLVRQRRHYQIVYFLMQGMQLAVCLPVARTLRKPIVMKVSGSGILPLLARSATGRLELRWLRRWARRILILNDGMRQEAVASGLPVHLLAWMPNPVDTDAFAPGDSVQRRALRAQRGLAAEAPIILYTGRLSQEKGLPWLLQGFAGVVRAVPNVLLVLVGDGPLRAELERQAEALGLDPSRIRFAGQVAPDEVADWTRLADIFALPSPAEGFSCALAEAMSASLACLACDIPANRQLIRSGHNGVLVPPGAPEAITTELLTLVRDAGARARLGRAARALILGCYTPGQVADRYEQLFASVIAPPGAEPADHVRFEPWPRTVQLEAAWRCHEQSGTTSGGAARAPSIEARPPATSVGAPSAQRRGGSGSDPVKSGEPLAGEE